MKKAKRNAVATTFLLSSGMLGEKGVVVDNKVTVL